MGHPFPEVPVSSSPGVAQWQDCVAHPGAGRSDDPGVMTRPGASGSDDHPQASG